MAEKMESAFEARAAVLHEHDSWSTQRTLRWPLPTASFDHPTSPSPHWGTASGRRVEVDFRLLLAEVKSQETKMDEMGLGPNNKISETVVPTSLQRPVSTKTFKIKPLPSIGRIVFWAGRSAGLQRDERRSGICVYTVDARCSDTVIVDGQCLPAVEFIMCRCQPCCHLFRQAAPPQKKEKMHSYHLKSFTCMHVLKFNISLLLSRWGIKLLTASESRKICLHLHVVVFEKLLIGLIEMLILILKAPCCCAMLWFGCTLEGWCISPLIYQSGT